jgi:hypothetical protein
VCEDIPQPSLRVRCFLLAGDVGMMLAAGFLGIFLCLVFEARRAELSS